jgi:CTP:molybdopterin cytidylyltransferase MocA/SAM-dependent methyltransferase
MTKGTVGLVLAAGAGSRFGGGKLLATIAGRAVLQHVLDALADAGVGESVVVLGQDAERIEAAIEWGSARRVVNPDPERGLSSSLQVGFATIGEDAGGVLVALGDQPLVSATVIRALLEAPEKRGRPIVVPVYADDRGRNPVLVRRPAFRLVGEASGDRGLGPVLEAHPELVSEIAADGTNPDVDTPEDLARAIEESWGARVRANREQVERLREVPDGTDFYAPVSSLFRADPTRTDDPVLDALLTLVRSGESWLDIGAGAGRFALPIARALDPSGGSVVALDPSRSMLEGLLEIAEDYAVENVRTIEARWPLTHARAVSDVEADVALIAHVGYDVEEIGPFVDGMEAAAARLCVAVLMERVPAAAANPFWPPVHGEERVPLPALPDLLELLEARGRRVSVERIAIEPRRFESREALEGFVRRQLWIDPAGPKEKRFQKALDTLAVQSADGWTLEGRGVGSVGIVTWGPR